MPRTAGSPNRNKAFLLKKLQDMYGKDFNPVLRMAENAVELQKIAEVESDSNSRKAALDGWDKVAQYVEPKLKATEISTVDSEGKVTGFKIEVVSASASKDT